MLTENVDSYYSTFPFRVITLYDIVIQMFLPTEFVETFENEFEKSFEILGRRRSDKDVGVRVKDCESDG